MTDTTWKITDRPGVKVVEVVTDPKGTTRATAASAVSTPGVSMRTLSINLAGLCLVTVVVTGSIAIAADSEEQAIHDTYNAWVEASNEKDIEKWSTFLAENPYFSPSNAPPLTTTEAVIDYYQNSFSDPHFSLDCEQQFVEISVTGEMAWSRGVCNFTFSDPDGQVGSGTSRWFKVWMKQSDGSWRGKVNTWKLLYQP